MKQLKYVIIKTAKLSTIKNKIIIKFPFDKETISNIKTINNRKWNPDKKYWTIPISIENCNILLSFNFIFQESLKTYYDKNKDSFTKPLPCDNIKEVEVTGLPYPLYPYQKKGVAFLESRNGRALIADEMGLGKTIQTLAWMKIHPELIPVIIVCPASLKGLWESEIKKWISDPEMILIANGQTPDFSYFTRKLSILIINYDIIRYWVKLIIKLSPKILILDECQNIKNNKAQRTKASKTVCKNIPHIIALSGTPIINRPIEIYNAVKIIKPDLFPDYFWFAKKYCGAKHNGFGWVFDGASDTQELHKKLTSTIMIRRLKKEVLKELPDKTFSFVPLEIDNRKEYDFAERDLSKFVSNKIENEFEEDLEKIQNKWGISSLDSQNHELKKIQQKKLNSLNILTEIEILKQLCVKGKMKEIYDWIDTFLESGNKLVLFAHHKFVIDLLMDRYKKISVKIDGSVPPSTRQKVVEIFQNNKKIKLFIGNMKAAGVGLTLTAASSVGIIEFPWTPGELDQAIDRCHRIGQKHNVNVYYLLAKNTIEERIAETLDEKRKILNQILDGKEAEKSSLLTELIKGLTKLEKGIDELENLKTVTKALKKDLENNPKVTFHKNYKI